VAALAAVGAGRARPRRRRPALAAAEQVPARAARQAAHQREVGARIRQLAAALRPDRPCRATVEAARSQGTGSVCLACCMSPSTFQRRCAAITYLCVCVCREIAWPQSHRPRTYHLTALHSRGPLAWPHTQTPKPPCSASRTAPHKVALAGGRAVRPAAAQAHSRGVARGARARRAPGRRGGRVRAVARHMPRPLALVAQLCAPPSP